LRFAVTQGISKEINITSKYFCSVEALSPEDKDPPEGKNIAKFGVPLALLENLRNQRLPTALADFFGNIKNGNGLILTEHVFSGLDRGMYHDGDPESDRRMLIYSRKPKFCWRFDTEPGRNRGNLVREDAPHGRVFVVLIQQLETIDDEGVSGIIRRWNWIREAVGLPGAPIEYDDRYYKRLWSRTS